MTRSKYGAVRTTIDNITFASKAEARRYSQLKMLEKAGQIRQLKIQPKYPLVFQVGAGGHRTANVGDYIADFWYLRIERGVEYPVIEDVKSKPTMTPVYRLKKKMVEAIYGITITEVA